MEAISLAKAVYSPDMTCGESVLSLGAMKGGGRIGRTGGLLRPKTALSPGCWLPVGGRGRPATVGTIS